MVPDPGHGPPLLVEPDGEIYLLLIQPDPSHLDALAMHMPRHRGPVDTKSLGEIINRSPLPVPGDQLAHIALGQPPRDPSGVGTALALCQPS